MFAKSFLLSVTICLTAAVTGAQSSSRTGTLTMKDHMAILSQPNVSDELGALPSIQIESIQATVPVDDRMNADAAFNEPFTESLRAGMQWYLAQRGLKILTSGADLRLSGVIDSYEGWKGWGHWGADVHLHVKLFRESELVLTGDLRSFLKYSDDEDVEAEERSKYRAHNLRGKFQEILFTRIGIDLSEKLISFLLENASAIAGSEVAPSQGGEGARGKLSIDATVPNAEVWIDGMLVGTVPIPELPLPAASHIIEVRKPGYVVWKRTVTVLEGAESHITAELEPEKAK